MQVINRNVVNKFLNKILKFYRHKFEVIGLKNLNTWRVRVSSIEVLKYSLVDMVCMCVVINNVTADVVICVGVNNVIMITADVIICVCINSVWYVRCGCVCWHKHCWLWHTCLCVLASTMLVTADMVVLV